MQVQRSWMYLENIFIGSEDIRKQLPKESVLFDQVHTTFMVQMQQLNSVRNVVQASRFCNLHATHLLPKALWQQVASLLGHYLSSVVMSMLSQAQ